MRRFVFLLVVLLLSAGQFARADEIITDIPLINPNSADVYYQINDAGSGLVQYGFIGSNITTSLFSGSIQMPTLPAGDYFTELELTLDIWNTTDEDTIAPGGEQIISWTPVCNGDLPAAECTPRPGYVSAVALDSVDFVLQGDNPVSLGVVSYGNQVGADLLSLGYAAYAGQDVSFDGTIETEFLMDPPVPLSGSSSYNVTALTQSPTEWVLQADITYQVAPIAPEPSTISLFVTGLVGLIFILRKARHADRGNALSASQ